MSLANVDPRILLILRAFRVGDISYIKGISNPPELVTTFAQDLGFPKSWGDISLLPAYGGAAATNVWKALGVSRDGLGGLPCEIVHGGISSNCTANSGLRGIDAFSRALAIYVPVSLMHLTIGDEGLCVFAGPHFAHPRDTTMEVVADVTTHHHLQIYSPKCRFPVNICFFYLVSHLHDANTRPGTFVPRYLPRLLGWSLWLCIPRELSVRKLHLD